MIWNEHLELKGTHAIFSPSTPSWINYSDEDVVRRYINSHAQTIGTLLHSYAESHIKHGFKINKYTKNEVILYLIINGIPDGVIDIDKYYDNLSAFVNDSIGYRMDPEVPLMFSKNIYGTADAISFRKNELRINDLKTGDSKPKIEQLMIYAALFCLEYKQKPQDIHIVLSLYINDGVIQHEPLPEEINAIMERIIATDKIIRDVKNGGIY